MFKAITAGMVVLFVTAYALSGFNEVEPGEFAIVIEQFGDDKGVRDEGLSVGTHWVEPFSLDVEVYDTKARQYGLEVQASTKDGQPVSIHITFEISLEAGMVKTLHSTIGRDYYNRVVEPAARASVRDALPNRPVRGTRDRRLRRSGQGRGHLPLEVLRDDARRSPLDATRGRAASGVRQGARHARSG